MRKQLIKLAPHKLATETVKRRVEHQQADFDDDIPRANLHFFDMKELFRVLLQSNVKDKMYCGIMEWQNKSDAVELWHTVACGSSNRTTSGIFAHSGTGAPVFVPDFVWFVCGHRECFCKDSKVEDDGFSNIHLGLVRCVGVNKIHPGRRYGKAVLDKSHASIPDA